MREPVVSTISGMKFAVIAHRRSATNEALAAAALSCGIEAAVIEPQRALVALGPGDMALARLDVREELDGIESGTGELERLAAEGVEVLNPPRALAAAHDKLLTARLLRLAGLPHPHTTLLAPALPAAAPDLPAVLKPRFGSWGRDVELCRTADELGEALARARSRSWFREHGAIVQELIEPQGSRLEAPSAEPPAPGHRAGDLRVVVAGGRVVGSAARVALPGEWRTNATLGANVIPAIAPPLAQGLAVAAVEAVGADLAGVDLLPTRNGWVVLEVNGAVDFRPLYAWGRDVYADAIAAVLDAAERRRPALAAV
jgi:[lysine-biosynthesis-protein LysW]--L-2-aminoadipate ligase